VNIPGPQSSTAEPVVGTAAQNAAAETLVTHNAVRNMLDSTIPTSALTDLSRTSTAYSSLHRSTMTLLPFDVLCPTSLATASRRAFHATTAAYAASILSGLWGYALKMR
jgi:hypothetical protein